MEKQIENQKKTRPGAPVFLPAHAKKNKLNKSKTPLTKPTLVIAKTMAGPSPHGELHILRQPTTSFEQVQRGGETVIKTMGDDAKERTEKKK